MFCQIGRLKKLVGRKGFSNNPAAEISEVMKLFEEDMAGLQRDISSLQRYARGVQKSIRQPEIGNRSQLCGYGQRLPIEKEGRNRHQFDGV